MNACEDRLTAFFKTLGDAKKMVLASSQNNRVTARMMSCIIRDGMFYFQTDRKMLKYRQMTANPLVALSMDNVQVEGTASFLGHPLESRNQFFAEAFKTHYKGSFDLYTALPDEVLVKVAPTMITLWEYEGKKPYRTIFDVAQGTCNKEFYEG